jgi:hypothetical protein
MTLLHLPRMTEHRLPAAVRALVLSLVRERYGDFGPTLATESWRRSTAARSRARPCVVG